MMNFIFDNTNIPEVKVNPFYIHRKVKERFKEVKLQRSNITGKYYLKFSIPDLMTAYGYSHMYDDEEVDSDNPLADPWVFNAVHIIIRQDVDYVLYSIDDMRTVYISGHYPKQITRNALNEAAAYVRSVINQRYVPVLSKKIKVEGDWHAFYIEEPDVP